MKITRSQLKRIIKEEIENVLGEDLSKDIRQAMKDIGPAWDQFTKTDLPGAGWDVQDKLEKKLNKDLNKDGKIGGEGDIHRSRRRHEEEARAMLSKFTDSQQKAKPSRRKVIVGNDALGIKFPIGWKMNTPGEREVAAQRMRQSIISNDLQGSEEIKKRQTSRTTGDVRVDRSSYSGSMSTLAWRKMWTKDKDGHWWHIWYK